MGFIAAAPAVDAGVVLVDVLDGNSVGQGAVATVADFVRADATIGADPGAMVYGLPEGVFAGSNNGGTPGDLLGTGDLANTFFASESGTGSASLTNKGNFNGDGILGDYRFRSGTQVGTVTVGGLQDVAAGEDILVTLWGVGDTDDSDTLFTLTYDGTPQNGTTDYDSGVPTEAAVQFTLGKVAGVDEFTFSYQVDPTTGAGFIGWSGLSISTAPAVTVPEPTSMTVMGIGAIGALVARRRRRE